MGLLFCPGGPGQADNSQTDRHVTTTRLYLIIDAEMAVSSTADTVERLLQAGDVACIRLQHSANSDALRQAAERLVPITARHEIALVVEDAVELVRQVSADGIHLSDGEIDPVEARSELGGDAIVGVRFNGSRHDIMEAGQQGADYIAFGAENLDDALWWAELFEIPCVAEASNDSDIEAIAQGSIEFLALHVPADPADARIFEQIERATQCIAQGQVKESA